MKPKRAKPFAANNASVKKLEAEGWCIPEVVEKRIPHCFITKDLWGFADIIAVSPTRKQTLLVQSTGGGNGPARVAKIKAELPPVDGGGPNRNESNEQ